MNNTQVIISLRDAVDRFMLEADAISNLLKMQATQKTRLRIKQTDLPTIAGETWSDTQIDESIAAISTLVEQARDSEPIQRLRTRTR